MLDQISIRYAALAIVLAVFASRPAIGGEYAHIRTVAVVSAIGDSLSLQGVGFGRFGGTQELVPITDWGIDAWMKDKVSQQLSGRFIIKPVSVDAAAPARCDGFEQCANSLPRTDAVDAYVLVFKHWVPEPLGGNSNIRGIGIYHHPGLGDSFTFVHAIYVVAVIEARTGEMIDHGTGRLPGGDFLGGHPDPVQDVPETLWPDGSTQLNAEQKNPVRNIVMKLLADSLPHALQNAGLIAQ
jgi:hypothetical protein